MRNKRSLVKGRGRRRRKAKDEMGEVDQEKSAGLAVENCARSIAQSVTAALPKISHCVRQEII
jgi:hypothetical protein